VPSWWAQVAAKYSGLQHGQFDPHLTADLLAAKLVGRRRSGTPLAHAAIRDLRSGRDPTEDNRFKYEDDPKGLTTPLFAHIRKVYPRDEGFGDDQRRIIRRGIPFGLPFDPPMGRGWGVDDERGLLFVAYMANIEEQFEYIQTKFANDPTGPKALLDGGSAAEQPGDKGTDPVIGLTRQGTVPAELRRPDPYGTAHLEFRRFVQTTGAMYAFAPAISALWQLAGKDPPTAKLAARRLRAG